MFDKPTLARKHLVVLMSSMFSTAELLQFLDATQGPALRTRLPEHNIEPMELMSRTVALLERDGLIEASLFDALQAIRPNRANDIIEVRRLYGFESPASIDAAGGVTRSRRNPHGVLILLVVAIAEAVALAAIALNRCEWHDAQVSPGADRSDGDAAMAAFACRKSMSLIEVIVNSSGPNVEQLVTEVRRHIEQCKPLLRRTDYDAQ